jgi:glycosyltransferase involved in cell wall biosynthesis
MAKPKRTQPADEAVAAESRSPPTRPGEPSRDAQRFRAAYEALIEALIEAAIKLAAAETEQQAQQAQITALEGELADTRAGLRNSQDLLRDAQQRFAETQAELALMEEKRDRLAHELQAVYASHSWRLTEPLRRVMAQRREWRPTISMLLARGRKQGRLAAANIAKFSRQAAHHATEVLGRWRGSGDRNHGERLLRRLTQLTGWWRLSWSRPRTMWGVTPILTLPLLAKCDRLLGFRSESLVFTVYHTTSSFDINLKAVSGFVYRTFPRWIGKFHRAILRLALTRYDVFHTFCDRGLLPVSGGLQIEPAEMEAIRRHGRRLYAYTYGADVRTREATLALGRYNLCVECPEPGRFCTCNDEKGARNIAAIGQHATALISMGDMLTYARNARNMHYWPVDTANFPKTGTDWIPGRTLRVGHAPNHPHFKGTQFLVDAIERLKAQGYAIELVSITGVANAEVIALFKSCDVVADQFIAGFHGYTALEAMALGKPVLCYLRDPRAAIDPANCPMINCSPDTVEQLLRECLDGDFDLAELGRRSRSYIEHYYSLEAVAIRLGKLYLETAAFPDRINRMIYRHVSDLEARLPSLLLGAPPVSWELAGKADQWMRFPAQAAAR